jgi:hypothetical protein
MADKNLNPEALVAEGLQLYSQGKLDEALSKWRTALKISPKHGRAKEYIKYIEDNRAALEDSFRQAQIAPQASAVAGTPGDTEPKESRAVSSEAVVEMKKEASGILLEAEEPPQKTPMIQRAGSVRGDFAVQDMLTNKYHLSPKRHPSEDATPRIDLDELKGKKPSKPPRVATEDFIEDVTAPAPVENGSPAQGATAKIFLDEEGSPSASTSVNGRARRPTPLTLIAGEGKSPEEEFAPAEATPVHLVLPEPTRLVKEKTAAEKKKSDEFLLDTKTSKFQAPMGSAESPSDMGLSAPRTGEISSISTDGEKAGGATVPGMGSGTPQKPAADVIQDFSSLKIEETAPGLLTPVSSPGKAGSTQADSMLASAKQLFEQGTFEGSLWLCEKILAMEPDHAEGQNLLKKNHSILLKQYHSTLGNLALIPIVQIPSQEIFWHKLDHRAGFLLSRIDGQTSFEDLIDISAMSEFDACRILSQLVLQGVIGPRR